IDGVHVGGMKPGAAQKLLEHRARSLERVPVVFVAGQRRWSVTPEQLGVRADWHAAVELARKHGDGFGPLRGFRRIGVRVFGAELAPPTQVYQAALGFEVNRFARAIYKPHHDPQLRLRGLEPVVIDGSAGRELDRPAAGRIVVAALAGFSRRPVVLPVRSEPTRVTRAQLAAAAGNVRTALSAAVQMRWRGVRWTISPYQLRGMLRLPGPGGPRLAIGGEGADRYFARPGPAGRPAARRGARAGRAVLRAARAGARPARSQCRLCGLAGRAGGNHPFARGATARPDGNVEEPTRGRALAGQAHGSRRRYHVDAFAHDPRGEGDGHP